MQTSKTGIDLIKHFEGCELYAYKCPAGVWTIGYGSTKGVKEGDTITQEEADELLLHEMEEYEGYINDLVETNLKQKFIEVAETEINTQVWSIYNNGTELLVGSNFGLGKIDINDNYQQLIDVKLTGRVYEIKESKRFQIISTCMYVDIKCLKKRRLRKKRKLRKKKKETEVMK